MYMLLQINVSFTSLCIYLLNMYYTYTCIDWTIIHQLALDIITSKASTRFHSEASEASKRTSIVIMVLITWGWDTFVY